MIVDGNKLVAIETDDDDDEDERDVGAATTCWAAVGFGVIDWVKSTIVMGAAASVCW